MFSLESVLMNKDQFHEKEIMMEKLSEYDNLIKAIGALSFVQQQMANHVPLIFRAWKEFVFEKNANRIHDLLSSKSEAEESMENQNREDEGQQEGEEDYEEHFYEGVGENEQYVRVIDDNDIDQEQSTHILPLDSSNFYHDHNKYNRQQSSYTEDNAISIQEDEEEESQSDKKHSQLDSDALIKSHGQPELENAKIMQRHAEEQGINPAQLYFKENTDEAIVTAEDYIDDEEEELAQRINKNAPQYDENDDSSIEQVLQDDEGNLYIQDENGELIPYELPEQFRNIKL